LSPETACAGRPVQRLDNGAKLKWMTVRLDEGRGSA
jgi:hypothetical protein